MTTVLKEIYEIMESKQTDHIVSINVIDRCVFTDFFVIGQCRTSRHLITVCDALTGWAKMHKHPIRIQGRSEDTTWIVLDLGSVFVHLFLEDTRKIFNLESLWEGSTHTLQLSSNNVS
ncbi:ribosome silencing factor [Holospora curviuscula]|uniref:Ribosomal silencing factor RsfS n=1 Tax=Holospora curviuscula TaxID=1082868 RepID=A0A2S5R9F8_9PROT|nr:ribosome silencing factor [Holospora curviuscula]PPE03961.1 Ribosomal silencing factor RsfS [Holospora curviuscula]